MTAEKERSPGGSGARALDLGELGGRTGGSGSLGPMRRRCCLEELGSTEEKRQRWLQTARVRKLSGGHWEEAGTQCGSEDCKEDGRVES